MAVLGKARTDEDSESQNKKENFHCQSLCVRFRASLALQRNPRDRYFAKKERLSSTANLGTA